MEILNVLAAALGAYAFSAVWYIGMSKRWIEAAGIPTDASGKPQGNGSTMPFVIAFVALVLVAGMMRHVFATAGLVTIGDGMMGGFGVGAFFITPWVGMNYAFGMRKFSLWWIDSVNAVAGCTIMGVILALF
jgi:Protein of unknown function (DUF1761)